jgi:sec-independent protein translocase protein TatA
MGRIGATELLIILGIAVLIFGPTKLPQLGKAMGQTIANFKKSSAKAEKEPLEEREKVES